MRTYITFGQDHLHKVNDTVFDKDCVAVIEAESQWAARDIAFDLFGPKFCTSYVDETQVEEFMHFYPRGKIPVNFTEETD